MNPSSAKKKLSFETLWIEPVLSILPEDPSEFRDAAESYRSSVPVSLLFNRADELSATFATRGRSIHLLARSVKGEERILFRCSCRESDCDHVWSTLLAVLAQGVRSGSEAVERAIDSNLFLATLLHQFARSGMTVMGSEMFETTSVRERAPKGWIDRFLSAAQGGRSRILSERLRELFANRRVYIPDYAIQQIVEGADSPVDTLQRFGPLIERVAKNYQLPPPPPDAELEEFLRSDRARDLHRKHVEDAARERLKRWLDSQSADPAGDPARIDVLVEYLPLNGGLKLATFSVLLSTRRLDRSPRSSAQLEQLVREVAQGKRSLPPEEARMLRALAPQASGFHARIDGQDQRFAIRNLAEWAAIWFPHPRVRTESGPAYLNHEVARLGFLPSPGDEPPRWAVMVPASVVSAMDAERAMRGAASDAPVALPSPAPESSPAVDPALPASDPTPPVEPSSLQSISSTTSPAFADPRAIPLAEAVIVVDGRSIEHGDDAQYFLESPGLLTPIEAGGMPLSVLRTLRQSESVPVELLREHPGGRELARRLARPRHHETVSPDLGPLVEFVPVEPIVRFRFDERRGMLFCGLSARAIDGTVYLRGEDDRWAPEEEFAEVVEVAAAATTDASAIEGAGAKSASAAVEVQLATITEGPPPEEILDVTFEEVARDAKPSRHAILRMPRPADIDAVEDWIETLIGRDAVPEIDERGRVSMRWHLKSAAVRRLRELWPRRPARGQFFGDAAFRALLVSRGRPRLGVKVERAGVDFLKVSVDLEEELRGIPLEKIKAILAASDDQMVVLPGGRVYERAALEDMRRDVETLLDLGLEFARDDQRLHVLQVAGKSGDALLAAAEGADGLSELAGEARRLLREFEGVPAAPIDPVTAGHLRPYQRHGADFLVWACESFGGALLADDMGLGKTVQVLAALTALRARELERPRESFAGVTGDDAEPEEPRRATLVICPASVARNWQREAAKFAPSLRVAVAERGTGRKKVLAEAADHDLVVMNYAIARRDLDTIRRVPWLAVVVDEAQAIKNPSADISKAVKKLDARRRIALTGTPIENRLSDLESIMEFAAPGYLPDLPPDQFGGGPEAEAAQYRLLRSRLRPVLLRRTKAEVAPELPDRIEERLDCEMTAKQKTAYLAEVKRTRLLLEGLDPNLVGKGRIEILAALTRLRQLCCDPDLLGMDTGSGKLDELMELIPELISEGHKVLVFSQFVRMLERIAPRLKKAGVPYRMYTGQTTNRQEVVDGFEADPTPSVLLISLKAGGTGLNLVSASHVVLFDPWWNPAVEAQAIDRAHRIGQDKTVVAFRMVTTGTIEERILELQEKKRGIVRNVLEEESFNRTLSRADFEFLLGG